MNSVFFYTIIGGFIAGIFIRSFVDLGVGFSALFLLLGVVLFVSERKMILFGILFFSVGTGMVRFDSSDREGPQTVLDPFLHAPVVLEGVIRNEPDERETNTRFTVRVEKVGSDVLRNRSNILVIAPREPRYRYGDRLRFEGDIKRPENFLDDVTQREVPYRSYLSKDGIYYETFQPRIELVNRGEGNFVAEQLFAFKRRFIENLNTAIPQPQASLLAGLVVGAKQSLGKKLLDDFRTVGVIHIVVLSGYNITIIAYFIEWLFSRLRKNLRMIVASLGIILFAVMVGAGATVVRASVMALFVILATSTGRTYQVTRALIIAGTLMILQNPKILVFDVSFQLSFLSTLALIFLSPIIEQRLLFVTEKWKIREVLTATVSTQLFVLPFLLYKMGQVSLVSLPVNLLILFFIPVTMLFGFLTGIAGFLSVGLSLPFAYLAYFLLSYELKVVEIFSALPFASVSVIHIPVFLVVFAYIGYALLFRRFREKKELARA